MLRIHRDINEQKIVQLPWLELIGVASCCTLLLILGAMVFPLLPQEVHATPDLANSTVTPRAGEVCSSDQYDPSVSINLPATINFDSVMPTSAGATTTATASLNITTTNTAGYDLYLYSSDGDNSLRPKVSSLANISSINAIAGDVGLTLSSLEPNTWGYNLGAEAPTEATIYSSIPTDNSTPIQTKDTTATAQADDTYTLSFGAKVDTTIPSGTYSDTITIAVVASPLVFRVQFNGNGADAGNMDLFGMGCPGQATQLPANTFTRDGYVFTGWNTAPDGSGVSYSDGGTYVVPHEPSEYLITLYAQWEKAYYIQDFTNPQCQSLASDANLTVIDKRDGNDYTVRYINGACWMTQNLRLSGGRTLTSADSNVTRNWTFPNNSLDDAGTNYIGNSYTEVGFFVNSNTSYGGYYNYCAASAGTVCSQTKADATQDICPKGWRLPTYNEMSGITGYVSAFSPVLSGRYYSGSLSYTGSSGYWWSATALSSSNQYDLYYDGSSLYAVNIGKDRGYSVRCIRSSSSSSGGDDSDNS